MFALHLCGQYLFIDSEAYVIDEARDEDDRLYVERCFLCSKVDTF